MKTAVWPSYFAGAIAFLLSFLLGGFFSAMLVHEEGHAIACLLFGRPFSWSLTHVDYIESPNPLVNIVIRLAGGIAQALFSLVLFWYVLKLEKNFLNRKKLNEIGPLKRSIFFGFELAFLTIAFHGVINGIWEGLFYQSYKQIHDNSLLWGTIILLCGIISFYILYKRPRIRFSPLNAYLFKSRGIGCKMKSTCPRFLFLRVFLCAN